jgi:polyvinyl alcohol dehydrogenase (cytochrome)
VWTAPALDPDRNVMYVTTGDNYSDPPTTTSDAVLALTMDTGKILWSKQLTAGDAYNSSCPLPGKFIARIPMALTSTSDPRLSWSVCPPRIAC